MTEVILAIFLKAALAGGIVGYDGTSGAPALCDGYSTPGFTSTETWDPLSGNTDACDSGNTDNVTLFGFVNSATLNCNHTAQRYSGGVAMEYLGGGSTEASIDLTSTASATKWTSIAVWFPASDDLVNGAGHLRFEDAGTADCRIELSTGTACGGGPCWHLDVAHTGTDTDIAHAYPVIHNEWYVLRLRRIEHASTGTCTACVHNAGTSATAPNIVSETWDCITVDYDDANVTDDVRLGPGNTKDIIYDQWIYNDSTTEIDICEYYNP